MKTAAQAITLSIVMASVLPVFAQSGTGTPGQGTPPIPAVTETVTVIETTPLPGTSTPIDKVPAPAQVSSAADLVKAGAIDLSSFMNARLNAVQINEVQGNPFQPDVNYRGYTASPLLGTPQGLSVYMDGVRLNQPFGDVVSWDLIPRNAILSMALMPGSNPLFGLNTLGGALSMQTKDGHSSPGTVAQSIYGRSMRRTLELEHGGSRQGGLHWFVSGNLFAEDGWRDESPSDVKQVFGKIGWRKPRTDAAFTVIGVNDSLNGNGLQEVGFLDRSYESVYTKPDTTNNRSTLVNLAVTRRATSRFTLSGNAYYRHLRTNTLNGDMNEDSLDQAIYQPGAAERNALAAAGYTGFPVSGADASNTPFPFWSCIGNVLLQDEPAEKCNGLINRTESTQHNGGLTGQATWVDRAGGSRYNVTVGGAFDRSTVVFGQSSELGYLLPDRGVFHLGVFADGVNGGDVDGEPFDARVNLDGTSQTASVYATNTTTIGGRAHLTLSGRYNRTTVRNRDLIRPGGAPGSLDGDHVFGRFNPAIGVTVDASARINLYGGYAESSRAATSIELGCADPESPCRLPNALAGDPPLDQVVTRTFEAGVRARAGARVSWNASWFRAENQDDILFVASEQTGFGYFRNFGETRRQGLELGLTSRAGRVTFGAGYTFLDATYQSDEVVSGSANSTNEEAEDGAPGLDGTIEIDKGNEIPLIARHVGKAFADIAVSDRLNVDVNVIASSGTWARGNENNLHEPDGVYYSGPGRTNGYAIVNIGARFDLGARWQLIGQVNNVLNRRYATAAQLGPNGFTDSETFIARPFPAIDGEFPVRHSTFVAPGSPITGWGGVRVKF